MDISNITENSLQVDGLQSNQKYRIGVRQWINGKWGTVVWLPAVTTLPPPPPPPVVGTDLMTVASQAGSLPLPADGIAVIKVPERVPGNATPNAAKGSGNYSWGKEVDPVYWKLWGKNLPLVQGQYTGTTDEIIQWAAARWGFNPDLLRAVAVQESTWNQFQIGDDCGPQGQASFSIIQIKNRYCNGNLAWGGYPATQQSTALALDFYGAYLRTCVDNGFYDGGNWLYGGKTVQQIADVQGWDYVVWGAVGSWFSGGWYDSGAQTYITSVKNHFANKDWQKI